MTLNLRPYKRLKEVRAQLAATEESREFHVTRAVAAEKERDELKYRQPKRLFIIAGDHRQAEVHAKMRGVPKNGWVFVDERGRHTRGLRGGQYVVVGTGQQRYDFPDLIREMNIIGAERVYWDEG